MLCKHFFIRVVALLVILLCRPCLAVDAEPIGWATLAGGTTGGQGGEVVTVTNKAEFVNAVSGDTPRIIQVVGTIHGDYNIPNVGSNKTIVGIGYDAGIVGFSVKVTDLSNVIIRNLTFRGAMPQDGLICRRAAHLWIDHCTFLDAADGLLDFSDQCDYVTVSWCRFYYTSKINRHRLSCLVGSTDDNPTDAGKLNITFHHNWWGGYVDQRMPRGRYGHDHVFNNYYSCTGNSYCIGGSWGFQVLLENNYFDHVNNPMNDAGRVDVGAGGTYRVEIKSVGNIFDGCTGNKSTYGAAFVPAYPYTLDPAANIPSIVKGGAGTTILVGDPALWPTKATVPMPANGDRNAAVASTLTWHAGSTAVSHNVCFGASPAGLVGYGNQAGTSFTTPALAADTEYYWRIDEVAADGSVVVGDLWTFKTIPGLPANLLHYWPFDVDFLDVARVFTSNPNNPFGAAWLDTDAEPLGEGCLDLTCPKDGLIAGWSESSTHTVFPNAAPMTVSLWFRPTVLPASDKTACMLGSKVGTQTNARTFRIELLPTGNCRLTVDSDTPEFGNLPALDRWNHVLVSIDASGQLHAWLNANETGSISLKTAASNNYNGQFTGIGFYGDDANGLHRGDYTGFIDDVAVWNVSSDLTFAEILYDDCIGRAAIGNPVFATDSIPNMDGIELRPYTGQSLTTFADGVGTFSKESGPEWLHVSPSGKLSGIPKDADAGQNTFTIRFENTSGVYDTATMTIDVANVFSGIKGLSDLAGVAMQWLSLDCVDVPACGGADLDGDTDVGIFDLDVLSRNWLADESLQLHLKLDETGGTVAYDESIYRRSGELVNGPIWSAGHVGGALDFDGMDDYVAVPYAPGLNAVDFTVGFWARVDGGANTYRAPVCSRNSGGGFCRGYNVYAGNNNTWDFWTGAGASLWDILKGPAVSPGEWTHVAITFCAASGPNLGGVYTGTKVLYINGTSAAISTTARYVPNSMEPFALGSISEAASFYFNGDLDDVRVYDAALSEQEIQSLSQ